MNANLYRLVFNRKTRTYVPSWEGARTQGRDQSGRTARRGAGLAAAIMALWAAGSASVFAGNGNPLPLPCTSCYANGVYTGFTNGNTQYQINGNVGTVTQYEQNVILNWQKFDIDPGYTVNFNQPNSVARALNRIWSGDPSRIQGTLKANGEVYLINQNGIIFANGAQVNVGGLVASTLDISDELFNNGFLTNTTQSTPAFSGSGNGFIKIEPGADLRTAEGGRILVFAPVVENHGTISTPGGQSILAAGNAVYLEASQDPNLRGMLVEVNNDAEPTDTAYRDQANLKYTTNGTVSNLGTILAERANSTLIGLAVNQEGRITATTSVTLNGSIKLLARDTAIAVSNDQGSGDAGTDVNDIRATRTGTLHLGQGSVTEVQPELNDSETTTDDQPFKTSRIELMGKQIALDNGSQVLAPAGNVTVAAIDMTPDLAQRTDDYAPYLFVVDSVADHGFLNPKYQVPVSTASDGPRIYMDRGSVIDVSGTRDVLVPIERNSVEVELRGPELADSPLQRNGPLRNKKIYVDIRRGTPLADYAGYEARIGRTVAERTASGGSVRLLSSGDFVMQDGSRINVSGGSLRYQDGYVKTTKLISQGKVFDISEASPDRFYDGIAGIYDEIHQKWGVTHTWLAEIGGEKGRKEAGYLEGKNAGSIEIVAPHQVLNGDFLANTLHGIYQRQPYDAGYDGGAYRYAYDRLPRGGQFVDGDKDASPNTITGDEFVTGSTFLVQHDRPALPADFAAATPLAAADQTGFSFSDNTVIPDTLFGSSGFTDFFFATDRDIQVPEGTNIAMPQGGSFELKALKIDFSGTLNGPGTSVRFTTRPTTYYGPDIYGNISLGAGARILTQGQWINDYLPLSTGTANAETLEPVLINGGSITMSSAADLQVGQGTVLDASAGAWLDENKNLHNGKAGAISLTGLLDLQSTDFRGYGTGANNPGGTLTLAQQGVDFSNSNAPIGEIEIGSNGQSGLGLLKLPSSFFRQGGFGAYNLSAKENLNVISGSEVNPSAQSLIPDNNMLRQGSSRDLYAAARVDYLPDYQRSPTSITLSQSDKNNGGLEIGQGTKVSVEAQGKITLKAGRQMNVFGILQAPAGQINLSLAGDLGDIAAFYPDQSIYLGPEAQLLAPGAVLLQPNPDGFNTGSVLSGGIVNINGADPVSMTGYLIGQKGSVIDVSGVSTDLDVPMAQQGNSIAYKKIHVAGDAGSVYMMAREGIQFDGTLKGDAESGTGAAGGNLLFGLADKNRPTSTSQFPQGITSKLILTSRPQSGFVTVSQAGQPVSSSNDGLAWIDPSDLTHTDANGNQTGFDQVVLTSQDSIVFKGGSTLAAKRRVTLEAPSISVDDDAAAKITTDYFSLGNTNTSQQTSTSPVSGTGTLDTYANLIDLQGNFSVSGVSRLAFHSNGDIRLRGVLQTDRYPGSLTTAADTVVLQADQVYPTTFGSFAVNVQDNSGNPAGTIEIQPGHGDSPVLSGGGSVTFSAKTIQHNGVIKAPIGHVAFNANEIFLNSGSLISVSGEGQTIPFGAILNGNTWSYFDEITPIPLPDKVVTLNGEDIQINSGSKIDVSGGGELYGYEFFSGPGGSKDVLDVAAPDTYAIVPWQSSPFAAFDENYYQLPEFTNTPTAYFDKSAIQPGDSIYLSESSGLPAGQYALMPARYALLDGAYLVKPVANTTDFLPIQNGVQTDGTYLVAGKYGAAGTDILSQRWSQFEITPASVVRTRSEYHDFAAGTFFADAAKANDQVAPPLPIDAGQLVIAATSSLSLEGTLRADHASDSRGSMVDLLGPNFDIVDKVGPKQDNMVQITADQLTGLNAESILLGGTRQSESDGIHLTVGTGSITVDTHGRELSAPELILAANDNVTMKSGSVIQTKGSVSQSNATAAEDSTESLTIDGNQNGALVRVSAGDRANIIRNNPDGSNGNVIVEDGARISSSNSIILDATSRTTLGSNGDLSGQSVSIASDRMILGESNQDSGLALTEQLLDQLSRFQTLTLRSYSSFDFYGDAKLGGLDGNGQHKIQDLTLQGAGLSGYGGDGKIATIDAANLTFSNPSQSKLSASVTGAGELAINADTVNLGEGDKGIQGFGKVNVSARDEITGQDTGTLTLTPPSGSLTSPTLNLQASRLTLENKADQTIDATGFAVNVTAPATPIALPAAQSIGSKLSLMADTITHRGVIELPGGTVSLEAKASDIDADHPALLLGKESRISAQGTSVAVLDQTSYIPAGNINLTAGNGSVVAETGAQIDVSGTGQSDAGQISASAVNGYVSLKGASVKGTAGEGYQTGSFNVDASTIGAVGSTGNDFSGLNDVLESGGFDASRHIRVRNGDLTIAASDTVTAHDFQLSADGLDGKGNIDIYGKVDASGEKGGSIGVYAARNLTQHDGSLLDAHATGPVTEASGTSGRGGKVTLASSSTTGYVDIESGSQIDVSGASSDRNGSVLIRASRNAANTDVNVSAVDGTINGAKEVVVEANKVYYRSTFSTIDVGTSSQFSKEAAYFYGTSPSYSNLTNMLSRLNKTGDTSFHIRPGVEIRSDGTNGTTGTLTLSYDWDLHNSTYWRFGPNKEPGILTFRAKKDLQINKTISDGFNLLTGYQTLTNDKSWSYRLIGGADLTSANVTDVVANAGSVKLGSSTAHGSSSNNLRVRTGTGFIDIAAGGDFQLYDKYSVVYTAGTSSSVPSLLRSDINNSLGNYFTKDGGDISIKARNNVVGALTDEFITQWLWRQGLQNDDNSYAKYPAWWINFGSSSVQSFRQNIGALGGGDVTITAGGDINTLGAVVPTTGYVLTPGGDATVLGGGDLRVTAGGNINSGIFYVGEGQGAIRAGGSLGSNVTKNNYPLYTALALGKGKFDVRSAGDLNLATVLNPTVLRQVTQSGTGYVSYFFTYDEHSAVSLASLAGNVNLNPDNTTSAIDTLMPSTNSGTSSRNAELVYPGKVEVSAPLGGITAGNADLFPSTQGVLTLLAGQDIVRTGTTAIYDAAPDSVMPASPSPDYLKDTLDPDTGITSPSVTSRLENAHNLNRPTIRLKAGGSILAQAGTEPSLVLPSPPEIEAGSDISNLSLQIQHSDTTDVSRITAGRDIGFDITTDPSYGITVDGPGRLELQAGRNVDLGNSKGIVTRGNIAIPALPSGGAQVTVFAGAGSKGSDPRAVIDKYLTPTGSAYETELIDFIKNLGSTVSGYSDALAQFQALSPSQQSPFIHHVFFNELKQGGRTAATGGSYERGYDAIKTLFPNSDYLGDLKMYQSQIKTEQGGDIDLFAPGGEINAGLASGTSGEDIGIVTVKGGDINAFVRNNFTVNQSRVFTLQGGGILIWSSEGNIDAGRGSKTVSSTPPPQLTVDLKTGQFVLDATQSVVGSGIRVLKASKDAVPGDVDLFAPAGQINAGDAGIGSAGNITIGAVLVVGADNISSVGTSTGVPAADTSNLSGTAGINNAGSDGSRVADENTKSLADAANQTEKALKDLQKSLANYRPAFLTVQVIGFGNDSE